MTYEVLVVRSSMPFELEGKSALVTGGARRIGRAIALALARAGADVGITYRKSHEEALQTAREIEVLGPRALAVACDVRSEDSVQAAINLLKTIVPPGLLNHTGNAGVDNGRWAARLGDQETTYEF